MLEFFKVTQTALGTAARVVLAQLRGVGQEGADNTAEPVDQAEVLHHVGFAARPKLSEKTEAVVVRVGDEVLVLAILDKSPRSTPPWTSTRASCSSTAPASPLGQSSRSGRPGTSSSTPRAGRMWWSTAGTAKVVRVGDPVNAGTLTATAGPYPVLFTYTPRSRGRRSGQRPRRR
jgi:hypothetical protein